MSNKITVVGAGSVGSTIAYTLMMNNISTEIVLVDINMDKAIGEAMDIRQGTPFGTPVSVYAGDYDDAAGSDIVIITSGMARKPGQTRLELAQTNVNIMKSIIKQIVKTAPDAIYIIVSNPVDILTYEVCKLSGLPEKQIIGSGTILDTARLREKLAETFCINMKNVHASVYGEHGDSSFVPWSAASISNIPIDKYQLSITGKADPFPVFDKNEIVEFMRTSGAQVIAHKGATFYAVAVSVCHICKCIFSGMNTALTVSSMMHGEYGINDVCLSTLNIVGRSGICGRILSPLNEDEIKSLRASADKLGEVIKNIDFS